MRTTKVRKADKCTLLGTVYYEGSIVRHHGLPGRKPALGCENLQFNSDRVATMAAYNRQTCMTCRTHSLLHYRFVTGPGRSSPRLRAPCSRI